MEESNFKFSFLGFSAVSRFKSINRAFRRGHVNQYGQPLPNRLFHNRANTSKRKGVDSRYLNTLKRKAYDDYRRLKAE